MKSTNTSKICILLFSFALSFIPFSLIKAQVLNLGQAALVENGFGATPNLAGANAVFISGNYAYVTGSGDVLEILDITLPGLPVHKGVIKNGDGGAIISDPRSVFVSGSYAYIACHTGVLEIVDVSDPSKPVHKGVIKNGPAGNLPYLTFAHSVYVYGNYAYVAAFGSYPNSLEIIDVSNPANPKHASSYNYYG